MANRSWPCQERVDEREDGRVRADADREGQHHRQAERWMLAQRARGVPEVLEHGLEAHRAAAIAALLLGPFDAAEDKPSAPKRLVRLDAGSGILLGFALDVEAELLRQLALHLLAPEECAQTISQIAPELVQHRSSLDINATVRARPRKTECGSPCRSARGSHALADGDARS